MNESYLKYIPDFIIRSFIRNYCQKRINECSQGGIEVEIQRKNLWHKHIKNSPLAIETNAANDQHYELPPEFFQLCLGKHRKYSSALWLQETSSLDEAEKLMLEKSMERANLKDGQKVLELGCGWGSLSFAMAKKFPKSYFTVVSNSYSQRININERAKLMGIQNIKVITCDMNKFNTNENYYDRILSVEMFEHMRNWENLMKKISLWLNDSGKFFVHIFTHRNYGYSYEIKDHTDWMSKYFFTGGQMPSIDQFSYFQDHLKIEEHWAVNGKNYQATSEAWLNNMDKNKKEIMGIFKNTYGKSASLWFTRWRIFYMSCAELFGYKNGNEWFVSHYLLSKREKTSKEICAAA